MRLHIAMKPQEAEATSRLRLLSAGAAKGIVEALAPPLRHETGVEIVATFGAVGAIKEALDAGTRCDVIVLTQKMISALADDARVLVDTVALLGAVRTGLQFATATAFPMSMTLRRFVRRSRSRTPSTFRIPSAPRPAFISSRCCKRWASIATWRRVCVPSPTEWRRCVRSPTKGGAVTSVARR